MRRSCHGRPAKYVHPNRKTLHPPGMDPWADVGRADAYLLQIWPTTPAPAAVRKTGSRLAAYWMGEEPPG